MSTPDNTGVRVIHAEIPDRPHAGVLVRVPATVDVPEPEQARVLASTTGPAGPPGRDGSPGPQGPKGDPGVGVDLRGSVPTESALPATGNTAGDGWITVDTGHLHVWDGATWVDAGRIQGEAGPKGDKGDKGDPGGKGDPGTTGTKGDKGDQGNPGPTGAKGDPGAVGAVLAAKTDPPRPTQPSSTWQIWLNSTTGDVFNIAPTESMWTRTGNIKGPKGDQGERGPKGNDGTGVDIKGSVANAAALPSTGNTQGDGYITADDGHLHVWEGTAWVDAGEIRGPQGDPGPKGDTGAAGPKGDKGEPGSGGAVIPPGGAQGDFLARWPPDQLYWIRNDAVHHATLNQNVSLNTVTHAGSCVVKQFTDGPSALSPASTILVVNDTDGQLGVEWIRQNVYTLPLDGSAGRTFTRLHTGATGRWTEWVETIAGGGGQPGPQGPKGDKGDTGAKGDKGDAGPGLRTGGAVGQALVKATASDFDTHWIDGVPTSPYQAVSDLDLATDSGWYACKNTSNAPVPGGRPYWVMVLKDVTVNPPTVLQIAYRLPTVGLPLTTGAVEQWQRINNGTDWSPWVRIGVGMSIPTNAALVAPWVAYAATYASPHYFIDGAGFVCLGGTMKGGSIGSGYANAAFTLPVGMRPALTRLFAAGGAGAAGSANSIMVIGTVDSRAGNVIAASGSANQFGLDGIRFYPDGVS